jgi:hypothetical protein
MRYLILIVPSLLLFGCPLNREKYDRTPAGWHVHLEDQGTIGTGLHDKAQLFALFDAAMERALDECAVKVGLDRGYCRSRIRKNDALYTLVDNFYFPVAPGSADAPTATFASGCTYNRYETTVAFYNKAAGTPADPSLVPPTAPSWTLKPSTTAPGLVYWGEERPGEQYPALGYELHWQFTEIP